MEHLFVTPSLELLARAQKYRELATSDPLHGPTTVLTAALSVEAFFNDLAIAIEILDISDPKNLAYLKETLDLIEELHGSITAKFEKTCLILTGSPIDKGSEPYQSFIFLKRIRDQYVHSKPEYGRLDYTNFQITGQCAIQREGPGNGIVQGLVARRLIRPEFAEGDYDWRDFLRIPEVGEWAVRTAESVQDKIRSWITHDRLLWAMTPTKDRQQQSIFWTSVDNTNS